MPVAQTASRELVERAVNYSFISFKQDYTNCRDGSDSGYSLDRVVQSNTAILKCNQNAKSNFLTRFHHN